jgi:hypothetical protein
MSEVQEKKKRGRKPKSDKEQKISSKDTSNQDNLLLHLNISRNTTTSNNIPIENEIFETDYCNYKPDMDTPNPYNDDDTFSSKPFELLNTSKEIYKNSNIKFIMKNVDEQLSTNVACYWCCHQFERVYLGLPIKYRNEIFEVYGCFCSFECMCAYNFYSNEKNNDTWEIYNLINIMANLMDYDQYIYPAPPRKCLNFFGGYMTIEEFRNFKSKNKIININKPPFVVIVDQIEEINDFYHKQQENIFSFDKERIDTLEKKINKQQEDNIQINFKNTLNSSMKIV